MKKRLIPVLLLLAVCLCACGQDAPTEPTRPAPEQITGETYDAGAFTLLVPEGWLAVQEPLGCALYPGSRDAGVFVGVVFRGPEDPYVSSRDQYRKKQDQEPVTVGDITWKVFTAKRQDIPYTVLTGQSDSCIFEVRICMEAESGQSLSLQDPEVQAILQSLKIQ